MLRLGVHAAVPPLSGAISFHSKIVIPPGNIEITQKLKLDGSFVVGAARFSQLNVQEKVNELSKKARRGRSERPWHLRWHPISVGCVSLDRGVLAHCTIFRLKCPA